MILLSILTILMAIWRWPVSVRHTLWDEHYLWNSHWLISFSVLCSWMVLRNQPRWYLRKSNVLFVSAMGLLAVLEVFIVGLILAYEREMPAAMLELLRILTLAEPIVLLLVALAMHTMILDGLIHQLERTLVHVSKNSARLKQMAERDPLTAVLNRHAFYSMVGSKRNDDNRPLGGSVAVIDIDNLKPLNDKYGHQAGDAAIRSVAKAIRSVVRAEDLLFRWGGDEFMVILPHVTIEESRWRFDKLNKLLAKTILPGLDHPIDITLSVGISPFSSTNSLEQAIEEADERMYTSKSEKKRERAKSTAS
jgi:diguanylate cyclase (GGDEF)-like protein